MIRPWPLVESALMADARVFQLHRERATSPRTGQDCDFYVLRTPNWVNVVPVTPEGELVLVRQYRQGVHAVTLEIPGGTMDPGDPSPEAAARRELLEETGYAAEVLRPIGWVHPNPAIQDTVCHSFLAQGAHPVAAQSPDGSEDLDVVLVPLDAIPDLVARGEITHSLVLCAFAMAFGLLPPVLAQESSPQPGQAPPPAPPLPTSPPPRGF